MQDDGTPKASRGTRYERIKDVGEFIFAVILTVYGVLGYYLLRDQLRVMEDQTAITQQQLLDAHRQSRSADAENKRLLDANEKLAEAAVRNAESAAIAADATRTMAQAAEANARSSGDMVTLNKESLSQAQESFRLDQRAWIGVKDRLGSKRFANVACSCFAAH